MFLGFLVLTKRIAIVLGVSLDSEVYCILRVWS